MEIQWELGWEFQFWIPIYGSGGIWNSASYLGIPLKNWNSISNYGIPAITYIGT
jgi:hypothetical protein